MAFTLSSISISAPSITRRSCQASTAVSAPSAVHIPRPPAPLLPPLSHDQSSNPATLPSSSCALHCPHFQMCSGCTQEFNLHRPLLIDEAVNFFKKLGVKFTFDSGRLWGWRCRAKLAVRGSSVQPLIGLYQEGTHTVVDIPDCQAHHPNINAVVKLLKQAIVELNVEPYDEDLGTGDLRYVQMAVTTHDTSLPTSERYNKGKVQVSLVWNSRNENSHTSEKLKVLANFLWRTGGPWSEDHLIHSVWANFQTSSNNIIFGNRWRYLLGERDFWEHVGGIDVSLAPSSFGQANTRAFDSLLRKLQKYVPYGASVIDLYAGSGVIGLSLASTRKCSSVKCVEVNKESRQAFTKTAERLPTNLDSSISWHHADTSIEPHSWLVGADVVVVDPPRKGLDPSLIKALQAVSSGTPKSKLLESNEMTKDEKRPWVLRTREASVSIGGRTQSQETQTSPQTLIYISCGWESFKEDCISLLSSKAWSLDKAHGFNFFPGTQSMEILAVFKRRSKGKRNSGKKKRPS
ncbi:unnamed protein product [Cuscuta epithymum]|uniref:Methyltransferase small domain-containing protein n=1 Tax=Cuscuta epithymum TaxID=186058 RepID=A0AAV0D095_9ASTE|nr:unnamed protein product [Cuscuta epithymum]